jgi:hypothetical protein
VSQRDAITWDLNASARPAQRARTCGPGLKRAGARGCAKAVVAHASPRVRVRLATMSKTSFVSGPAFFKLAASDAQTTLCHYDDNLFFVIACALERQQEWKRLRQVLRPEARCFGRETRESSTGSSAMSHRPASVGVPEACPSRHSGVRDRLGMALPGAIIGAFGGRKRQSFGGRNGSGSTDPSRCCRRRRAHGLPGSAPVLPGLQGARPEPCVTALSVGSTVRSPDCLGEVRATRHPLGFSSITAGWRRLKGRRAAPRPSGGYRARSCGPGGAGRSRHRHASPTRRPAARLLPP